MRRTRRVVAVAWSLVACTPAGPAPTGEPVKASPPTKASEPKPAPPLPAAPSMADAPAVPPVEVLVGIGDCNPMTAPAKLTDVQSGLLPALQAARDVSCRPEVFGMATPAVRESLKVPPEVSLSLGRGWASVGVPAGTKVEDVLAALGIAQARLRAVPGMKTRWRVGIGERADVVRPFGPGALEIFAAGVNEAEAMGAELLDIPAGALVEGAIGVVMPEGTLRFLPDPYAAAATVSALVALAKQRGLLKEPPEQAHARLESLGERFTLGRFSRGSGAAERVGVILQPRRTTLPAAELAAGLGLADANHRRIQIYDADPDRLAVGGATPFAWNGLELEVELDERPGGGFGLAGWDVAAILVLPATP